MFASLVAFVAFASFSRKETVLGWIRPQQALVRMHSQGDWTIKKVFVREGQLVGDTQPLFLASELSGVQGGDKPGHWNAGVVLSGAA